MTLSVTHPPCSSLLTLKAASGPQSHCKEGIHFFSIWHRSHLILSNLVLILTKSCTVGQAFQSKRSEMILSLYIKWIFGNYEQLFDEWVMGLFSFKQTSLTFKPLPKECTQCWLSWTLPDHHTSSPPAWKTRPKGGRYRSNRAGYRLQKLEVCWSLWCDKYVHSVCVITISARRQREKFHTTVLAMAIWHPSSRLVQSLSDYTWSPSTPVSSRAKQSVDTTVWK